MSVFFVHAAALLKAAITLMNYQHIFKFKIYLTSLINIPLGQLQQDAIQL